MIGHLDFIHSMIQVYGIDILTLTDEYMCRLNKQSLVQILAFSLLSAESLSGPMAYCQLDSKEQI